MIETKKYSDGTEVTGLSPLPVLSPRQQDTKDALRNLKDIENFMGGRSGPSIRLRALIERLGESL